MIKQATLVIFIEHYGYQSDINCEFSMEMWTDVFITAKHQLKYNVDVRKVALNRK